MKILITGATGLIGSELGKYLSQYGHELFVVSRNLNQANLNLKFNAKIIEGDLVKQSLELPEVDVVINLIGDNIGSSRWSDDKKREVIKSRTGSIYHLFQSLKTAPKVFIQATAIGIYGDGQDYLKSDQEEPLFDESSSVGSGFLSEVCKKWEDEYLKEQKKFSQTRFVTARLGVVLSELGGAFQKMLLPFELGFGQVLGNGQQWMSWVHINDVVKAFDFFINSQVSGVYNIVSPDCVNNKSLTLKINEILDKQNIINKFFPVPKVLLKLALGEMSELVLASQRVSSKKLLDAGFKFEFSDINKALNDLLKYHIGHNHVFVTEQFFNKPIDEIFDFFSEANNLDKITPPLLKFKILSISTPQIQAGTFLDYTLKVHSIPIQWRTKINEWNPPKMFSDNQIKGPYRKWYHTHEFIEVNGGTLMRDRIQYQLPLGTLGDLGGLWLVKSDIQQIFDYRRSQMASFLL